MSNYLISGVTTDGNYSTDKINDQDERFYFSIVFYSDADLSQVVTPTAGTISINASETGDQYGEAGVIDATLAGAVSTYPRINFTGSISSVSVNLDGIVGASHFRFKIGSYT